MTDPQGHWDGTYSAKSETQVSWFQAHAERSLTLIKSLARDRAAAIIDVGGGASRLVDDLLADRYTDLSVLDVSEVGLSRSKARLGSAADKVSWIVADVTQWRPRRQWDLWHDRAVFHFLTAAEQQDAYIAALLQGTRTGSAVVMATFALDGPERCSGLPVRRYSADTLAERLGLSFELLSHARESHATPFGTTQQFTYAAFRRI